jgi:putative phosphoesterase
MRIAVISDTHLLGVSEDLERIDREHLSAADLVVHAGDIVSLEIIQFLKKRNFVGVRGNMDLPEVKSLLPEKEVIKMGPYRIGLTHGWGPGQGLEDRIDELFREMDIIIYGHSHEPANHVKRETLFFNPGTATGYSSSGFHSLGILELNETIHAEIISL